MGMVDEEVVLLQEEVTWGFEVVVVSDLTSFSPAVQIFLPQSCFHTFLHRYWLLSVGVATQGVIGRMVVSDAALA